MLEKFFKRDNVKKPEETREQVFQEMRTKLAEGKTLGEGGNDDFKRMKKFGIEFKDIVPGAEKNNLG
ncbi:hypothetical protein KKG24_03780 [Patescibacteria group bacterium]|nr:hypothetical protein [Patescibacteria group bacterium]